MPEDMKPSARIRRALAEKRRAEREYYRSNGNLTTATRASDADHAWRTLMRELDAEWAAALPPAPTPREGEGQTEGA